MPVCGWRLWRSEIRGTALPSAGFHARLFRQSRPDMDLRAGRPWAYDIQNELKGANFGIVCVDSTNLDHPWLLFEAGALSKAFDRGRVCPFLFHVDRTQLPMALRMLQGVEATGDGTRNLLLSINGSLGAMTLLYDQISDYVKLETVRILGGTRRKRAPQRVIYAKRRKRIFRRQSKR